MSLVAQVWWVMRQAKMPLTAKQLHGRILDNFGDNPRLKAKTGFQKILNHLRPEVYRKFKGSKNMEYEAIQDIPAVDAGKVLMMNAPEVYMRACSSQTVQLSV